MGSLQESVMKSFPPKSGRPGPLPALLGTLILITSTIAAQPPAHAQLASPISSAPTNIIVPGEIVWADLVTTDVETAVAFYADVFGWDIRRSKDPGYVELAHDGDVICAVARFDDEDVTPGNARWLVSISVADVDNSAQKVELHGGSILEASEDFPDRGRLAVVSDDQDAVFMLLRASGGDPPGNRHVAGAWGWAELWTNDVEKAVAFYEEVIGYRAVRVPREDGQHPVMLTTLKRPRGTIVKIPSANVEPNWLPYVPVADGRATLQRIEVAGGSVLLTSDEVEGDTGSFAAVVADPTGGVFAIQEMEAGR